MEGNASFSGKKLGINPAPGCQRGEYVYNVEETENQQEARI